MIAYHNSPYVAFKKFIKKFVRPGGFWYRALNLASSVIESENKLFQLREVLLYPLYGQTYMNPTLHRVFQSMGRYLKDREVDVVDVGAHHGWFSTIAPRYFRVRKTRAFEPVQDNRPLLDPLVSKLKNFSIKYELVGSKIGRETFHQYEDAAISSVLPLNPGFDRPASTRAGLVSKTVIPMTTLDHELAGEAPDSRRPILLKIDTQGHELEVLRGAEELFRQGRVAVVYTEISIQDMYLHHGNWIELLQFFQKHEMDMLEFIPGLRSKVNGSIAECDAVFVRRQAPNGRDPSR